MRTGINGLFDQITTALSSQKGNLRVLESRVPIEKQMEFFSFTDNVRSKKLKETIDEQIAILNSPDATERDRKTVIASLAISGDVKAYRALQTWNETWNDEWSSMALIQARMMLESELSDESRIFISTGLGGRDGKLRFTGLFLSTRMKPFSDYQRNLIEEELPYYIDRHGGETEEVTVGKNYFTIVFLNALDNDVRTMIRNAVKECNQYGDFINSEYIITNVRRFSQEEIEREINKYR
jgi:hypothetical protein